MVIIERKGILSKLGAADTDMDVLLKYAENMFSPRNSSVDEDGFIEKWETVL